MDAETFYLCARSRKYHKLDQTAPLTHLNLDYPCTSKAGPRQAVSIRWRISRRGGAPNSCPLLSASSTGRRNTLSLREKIDYRSISQRFRGGTRAAEKIALWDTWLRRGSLKAIGRPFGKPSSLFIASWPPVLRRPVEITALSGQSNRARVCPLL